MVASETTIKDSEHIPHAEYYSNVDEIHSIYRTGKLPQELKLYTGHSKLEVHLVVYYWLMVVCKNLHFHFTLLMDKAGQCSLLVTLPLIQPLSVL